jgi:hypothetical protein
MELGRLVRDHLAARLKDLKLSTALVDKDLGYELRCAGPVPLDAGYIRDFCYGVISRAPGRARGLVVPRATGA